MENDQTGFAAELEAIARELGVASAGLATLDLAHVIDQRVRASVAAEAEACDQAGDLEAALEKRGDWPRQRDSCAAQGRDDQLLRRRVARRRWAQSCRASKNGASCRSNSTGPPETSWLMLRLATIDEAEQRLEGVDSATLEAELADLEPDSRTRINAAAISFPSHSKAADSVEAVGGDDAVAQNRGTAAHDAARHRGEGASRI